MMIRTLAVRSALVGISVGMAVTLSACLPPGGDLMPTLAPPTPEPTQSSFVSPTPTPSDTAAPVEKPTPVSIPCGSIVDAQTMYDFNPNFGLLASFSPDAGTLTARAANDKGTVCRWVNQTSGDTIDVSISQPGASGLSAAQSAAQSGTAANGLGDAAFFSHSGQTGVMQVFAGARWITVTSVYLASPGDARNIVESAVAASR